MDRRAWRATVHEVTIVEHDWMTEHTHMHNHIGVCVRVCVCVCVCVGFPGVASCTEPIHQCRRHNRHRFDSWVEKIPWRRAWQPTPLFLPGESHGQRSLAGYSPEGHTESDTTEVTERTCMHSSVIAVLPVKSSGLGSSPGSVPRPPYPHL